MKKLMTVIAATAMAFGLYAEQKEVNPTKIDFTTKEVGTFDWANDIDGDWNASFWSAAEGADITTEIKAGASSNFLSFEGDELMRLARAKPDTDLDTVAIDGGVNFEQSVKFSGFEEAPADLAEDAKIAVWLMANDTETNLYVSTASLSADAFAPTAQNVKIEGVDVTPDQFCNLKITAIPAYTTKQGIIPGFVISVDGVELEGAAGLFPAEPDFGTITPAAAALITAGKLFPSRVAYDEAAGGELTGVAFKGTGAIESIDISAGNDYEVAATIEAPEHTTIVSVTVGGVAIQPNENDEYVVAKGADVVVTLQADQGWKINPTSKTFSAVDGETEFDFDDIEVTEDVTGTVLLITEDGSKTNNYETLALALAAAQSGDIVMPTATIAELQTTITVKEGVTLDLNNQIVNVDFHQTKLSNSGTIVIYNNSLALVNNWYIGGNFEAGEALTDGSNFLFPKGTQMDVAKQTAVQTAITITGENIQWGLPFESNKLVTVVGTATINAKIYPTATLTVPNAITPTLTTIEGFEVKSTVGETTTTWAAEEKQGGDIPADPEQDITDDTKPEDIGLDPEGPFKEADKDELIKLSKWANKADVKAAAINEYMQFGVGGAPLTEMADAYLLDCTPAQLTTAKEAFKFNAEDLAAAMDGTEITATFAGKTYNGTIVIKAFSDVACTTPAEDEADAKFYKAFLVK